MAVPSGAGVSWLPKRCSSARRACRGALTRTRPGQPCIGGGSGSDAGAAGCGRTTWRCCGTCRRASACTALMLATSSTPSPSPRTATGCVPPHRCPLHPRDDFVILYFVYIYNTINAQFNSLIPKYHHVGCIQISKSSLGSSGITRFFSYSRL